MLVVVSVGDSISVSAIPLVTWEDATPQGRNLALHPPRGQLLVLVASRLSVSCRGGTAGVHPDGNSPPQPTHCPPPRSLESQSHTLQPQPSQPLAIPRSKRPCQQWRLLSSGPDYSLAPLRCGDIHYKIMAVLCAHHWICSSDSRLMWVS